MTRTERDIAERSLLAHIITVPSVLDACFAEMFAVPSNRAIYRAFQAEYDRTRPAFDAPAALLAGELPLSNLSAIYDGTRSGQRYEQLVKEAWLSDEITTLAARVGEMNGLDALLTTQKRMEELAARVGIRTSGPEMGYPEYLDLEAVLHRTGIEHIDHYYGGLADGEKTVIAARPSVGKTSFGCTLAANMTLIGSAAHIHSYEMRPNNVWNFTTSRMTLDGAFPVTINDIRRRKFDEEQKRRLIDAYTRLNDYGMRVHNSAGMEVRQLCTTIETSKAPIHIVDHLGCVPTDGMSKEYELVTSASNRLREAAKRSGKIIISLVQLHRVEQNHTPTMNDLRGSGHVEQDADTIMFIHEPDRDENRAQGLRVVDAKIIVEKAREGQPGSFPVRINRPHAYVFTQTNSEQLPAF